MSEDGRKLAELEARASEAKHENLDATLAAREREDAAEAQGRRVARVAPATFRDPGPAAEKVEQSLVERFREQHADVGRAAQLAMRDEEARARQEYDGTDGE